MKQIIALAGIALTVSPAAAGDVFTDSASFMANLVGPSYTEGFDSVGPGVSDPLSFDDGNFAYVISPVGGNSPSLFNDPGVISTDNALDGLQIVFTTGNVTAVGGNFWSTDISLLPIVAEVTINLSDGQSTTFTSSSPGDYRGFTSDVAIDSIEIFADDSVTNAWSTLDNLTVGRAIPAPGAVAVLGLGGLLAGRRRR
ncbi:MAG: hypothetical protein AAGA55_12875 [Planctomycetota bacterium]